MHELMIIAKRSLSNLDCDINFWTDSKVVLGWLTNPDLNLARFVKRRVDAILRVAHSGAWSYVSTGWNPADVGTREAAYKNPDHLKLWLNGPSFLLMDSVVVSAPGENSCSLL